MGTRKKSLGCFREHCILKHWVGVLRIKVVFLFDLFSIDTPHVQQRRSEMLMS